MASPDALYAALDLFDRPSLVAIMRTRALPPNLLTLIQIAAGSPDPITNAVLKTGRPAREVRTAAIFYIRQVMWTPGADNYRVLGVDRDAPQPRIAEQVRWLMKWLHPDVTGGKAGPEAAARVLKAWQTLKTADRRKNYDRVLRQIERPPLRRLRKRKALRVVQRPVPWMGGINQKARPVRRSSFIAGLSSLAVVVAAMMRAGRIQLRRARLDAKSRTETTPESSDRREVRGAVGADLVENR
jgi:hypothetical protein